MERKKFEDDLRMKVAVNNRLDAELEELRPAHEQLQAEHESTTQQLQLAQVNPTETNGK